MTRPSLAAAPLAAGRAASLAAFLATALLAATPATAQVIAPGGPGFAPAVPPAATPVPAPDAAERRRAELDRLLDALPAAPDDAAAAMLENRLRTLWGAGGSPAVSLLMRRAIRNLEANAPAEAAEDLDAAITLQPDFAESWILRGRALGAAGDPRAAASDLREALRLEPRHFGALLALSSLLEEAGDLAGALRGLEAALAIHPRLPGGAARQRDLRRRALGDDT